MLLSLIACANIYNIYFCAFYTRVRILKLWFRGSTLSLCDVMDAHSAASGLCDSATRRKMRTAPIAAQSTARVSEIDRGYTRACDADV